MIDAFMGYVSQTLRKDNIAVMIQAHDGSQYIVDKKHFVTRRGRSIAQKGHLESVIKAARRTLRYLDKSATDEDFEIFQPRNLGPNRTHFVVWFPAPEAFRLDDLYWKQHLFPVEAENLFTRAQLRAVKYVSAEARKLHERRLQLAA